MTGRNERDRRLSAEGEDRLFRERREAITEGDDAEAGGEESDHDNPKPGGAGAVDQTDEKQGGANSAADDGNRRGGGQAPGAREGGQVPDTHDLEGSAVLSLITMVWFVLFTAAMSEQLPVQTYLAWGGVGYVLLFALGFLVGRKEPGTESARPRPAVGFESRVTVLLIMFAFMFYAFIGGGDPRAGWGPPLVWVPAVLLPAFVVGGALDGALLGVIARGLPCRTPWHALHFIVSERRRGAGARQQRETSS